MAGPALGRALGSQLSVGAPLQHEAVALAAFVFNGAVTALTGRHVFAPGRVTAHRVRGAVLLYLDVAALFAIACGALAMIVHGAFGSAAGLALNCGVSFDADVPFNRTWNPGAEQSRHASRGLEALAGAWDAFDAALSVARRVSTEDRRTYRLVSRYGRLQHWLGHEEAADLEPFRKRLVDHARRNGAITDATVLFGARVAEAEWTTMNAARAVVGRHPGPIFRMLGALGLSDQATGSGRDDLISTRAVARVRNAFERTVDSAEVRAVLGCSVAQLTRYVEAGVVVVFCRGGPTVSAVYEREGIERLARELMGGLPQVEAVSPDMLVLKRANLAARLGEEGVTRALADGRIRPRALLVPDGGARSVHNVLVSRADVARLRRERDRTYTMTEAGPLLRVHRFTLGKLRPLLGSVPSDGRLAAEEIREFRRRFASLREISAAHPGLGPRREIVDRLRARGVAPVLEGRWIEPFFEREAVAGLIGAVPRSRSRPSFASANREVAKAIAHWTT